MPTKREIYASLTPGSAYQYITPRCLLIHSSSEDAHLDQFAARIEKIRKGGGEDQTLVLYKQPSTILLSFLVPKTKLHRHARHVLPLLEHISAPYTFTLQLLTSTVVGFQLTSLPTLGLPLLNDITPISSHLSHFRVSVNHLTALLTGLSNLKAAAFSQPQRPSDPCQCTDLTNAADALGISTQALEAAVTQETLNGAVECLTSEQATLKKEKVVKEIHEEIWRYIVQKVNVKTQKEEGPQRIHIHATGGMSSATNVPSVIANEFAETVLGENAKVSLSECVQNATEKKESEAALFDTLKEKGFEAKKNKLYVNYSFGKVVYKEPKFIYENTSIRKELQELFANSANAFMRELFQGQNYETIIQSSQKRIRAIQEEFDNVWVQAHKDDIDSIKPWDMPNVSTTLTQKSFTRYIKATDTDEDFGKAVQATIVSNKLTEADISMQADRVVLSDAACIALFETEINEAPTDQDDVSSVGSATSQTLTMLDPETGGISDKTLENMKANPKIQEISVPTSSQRKRWVITVWCLTWWIPTFMIKCCGMRRPDIIMAWREKVALCVLIFLISGLTLFFITGFPKLLCPATKLYQLSEISSHTTAGSDLWVAAGGYINDFSFLDHNNGNAGQLQEFAGADASARFNMVPDDWAACKGASIGSMTNIPEQRFSPYNDTLQTHGSDTILQLFTSPTKLSTYKGRVAYTEDQIAKMEQTDYVVMLNDNVYSFKDYANFQSFYYPYSVIALVQQNAGKDITKLWQSFKFTDNTGAPDYYQDQGLFSTKNQVLACMNKVQFMGVHDTRDTPQCKAANGILLGTMILIVGIMVVRFLAALQLTSGRNPEISDKFVIIQIPCYTEGDESLRKTIDSVVKLKYNDRFKLLFIIADGMIIGAGNDKSTPRLVLDILGVDPEFDPPSFTYLALGEGSKQHNKAKVYSGLYEKAGHMVPYIVVVKVGKETEKQRPGNRGKRDSQMIMMRFLQKVHYKLKMNPLELELYHHFANVIGIVPAEYEFCLMIDSDTDVLADSLAKLVAACQNNQKIMGICGETTVANARKSFVTMLQVYEYYISHHLAKAFESLFGTVTCLPGCFSMYRIRSGDTPILVNRHLIEEYSENNVDTLHKKNLLSLGEDRYLTTLMLKNFPNYKTKFIASAQARTIAPDSWSVLLSQRRRWINSTVHNLHELLSIELCGCFFFSMRFVVAADLYATMTMPAALGYLGYLIYSAVEANYISTISLIMICSAYGLQILIFILKGKFEHIGWVVFYLLGMPFFNGFIPLYSFWHFDDFSWGNTRMVVGEKNGKLQIQEKDTFDPSVIEEVSWSDHEKVMSQGKVARHASTAGSGPSVVSYGASVPVYPGGSVVSGSVAMSLPSDDAIAAEIRRYLSDVDLTRTTKKSVREHVSRTFGVNLTSKRVFMNQVVEDTLSGK